MLRSLFSRANHLFYGTTVSSTIQTKSGSKLVGEVWKPITPGVYHLEIQSNDNDWRISRSQHCPNLNSNWLSLNPKARPRVIQAISQADNDYLLVPRQFQGLVEISFRHAHSGCGFLNPEKYRLLFDSEKILRVEHYDQTLVYQSD